MFRVRARTSEPLVRPGAEERLGRGIYPWSEDLATAGENLVQGLFEVRRAVGHILADLLGVLFPALPDLLLEQLLEVAVPQPVLPLGRVIDHHVGDERPREPPG